MIHIVIGLISFAAIFGGALTGLFVRRRLPGHHLSSETQSVVTVAVAVIGTLSALVLGLMISAANSSFSKRSDEVRELSLQVIRVERNLRRYGPEADAARAKLRAWATIKLQQLSPEKGQPPPSPEKGIETLESLQDALLALTPSDERQKVSSHTVPDPVEQPNLRAMGLGTARGAQHPRPIPRFADLLAGHCFRQLRTVRAGKCHNNCRVISVYTSCFRWNLFD
jgi:hypothetical protein